MTAYLVCDSLRTARNVAEIDWGWTPSGPDSWRRPDGKEVRYCGDSPEWFRGLPRETEVYMAYGSWRRPDWRQLEVAIELGQLIEVQA